MVFALDRRYFALRDYARRHAECRSLGISAGALVVDVGSGQEPHPRANVLCDKFVSDSTERSVGGGLRVDRPLIVSDATDTPFPDKAFDFAFCAHLLEHMDEPDRLLRELQRISHAGYIETPSKTYEKLFGWRFHRWFVSLDDNRLLIEPKDRAIFDGDLNSWFATHLQRSDFWRTFIPRLRRFGLLTVYVWRDEILYEITGRAAPNSDAEFFSAEGESSLEEMRAALAALPARQTRRAAVKERVDRFARRGSDGKVPALLARLECPICRQPLAAEADEYVCFECSARYPIVNQSAIFTA
jgi:SAM-dependent methyltransferase